MRLMLALGVETMKLPGESHLSGTNVGHYEDVDGFKTTTTNLIFNRSSDTAPGVLAEGHCSCNDTGGA